MIHVDDDALLANVVSAYDDTLAVLDDEIRLVRDAMQQPGSDWRLTQSRAAWEQMRKDAERDGIRYDLVRFAGKDLTPSERIRHQESLRRSEARGFICLLGVKARYIKPTDAGRSHLAALNSQPAGDGSNPSPEREGTH